MEPKATTASIERLLVDAGIAAGMRVIDLGCGVGEVTRLIARLVGEDGHVTGIDRQARAIVAATEQAERAGLSNITFVEQDLSEPLPASSPYDAAVARRVLMYLPDPSGVVSAVADALRPGGIAVFQEIDLDTLERRLADERARAGGAYVRNLSFGVWASKP